MTLLSRFDPLTLAFCSALISGAMLAFMLLMRVALRAVDRRLDIWIAGDAVLLCGRVGVTCALWGPGLGVSVSPLALIAPLAFASTCIHAMALRVARRPATRLRWAMPAGLALVVAMYAMEGWMNELQLRELSFAGVLASWSWMLYEALRIVPRSFGGKALIGLSGAILCADLGSILPGLQNPTVQFGMFVQLLLAVASTPCFLMWFQESLRLKLTEIAVTDALTATLNRHGLMPRLQRAVDHARHFRQPLSVVICDLDHFKQVNDVHGHQVGDRVLRNFAAVAQRSLRSTDLLGRWGGEEFLIVLPDTSLAAAAAIAERIRAACELPCADLPRFTMSAGVASVEESDWHAGFDSVLAAADQRLYAAKVTRNRVVA